MLFEQEDFDSHKSIGDSVANSTHPLYEFEEVDEADEDEEVSWASFDPREIDIAVEQYSIDAIVAKLEYRLSDLEAEVLPSGESIIDLNSEFQRSRDLWTPKQMSKLIESFLIRFPVPPFYFDGTDKKRWQVVDGLQRLSTLYKFIIEDRRPLKLQGLEFLDSLNGKYYSELNETLKRTLRNAQIVTYIIRPGTPKQVKYRLYERINTGSLKLNAQEIRHALNVGKPTQYIQSLVSMQDFERLVKTSNRRMQDRELVLRYLAFKIKPSSEYQAPFFIYLNDTMEHLRALPRHLQVQYKYDFRKALRLAERILSPVNTFSRSIFNQDVNYGLNKALFEVWTVILSNLSREQVKRLLSNKTILRREYQNLLNDTEFISLITRSTTHTDRVKRRFFLMNNIVQPLS